MFGKRGWALLRREENRKVLAWLGSGVMALATAGWAVFLYSQNGRDGSRADCTVTAERSIVACDGGVRVNGGVSITDKD